MIGRYKNLRIYQEIFTSKDFIRIMIAIGVILLSQVVYRLPDFAVANYPSVNYLWVSNLLLIIALFLTGVPVILEAIKGLLAKKINVDELVSIAVIACVATGNFLEGAIVSTIMATGAMVEEAVSDSARNAIKKLIEITPDKVAILMPDGSETLVEVDDLKIGEILVIRPGDTIAVDAIIQEGSAAIDESSLTGESVPVVKKTGQMLYAGTVNNDGYLKAKVERVGKDSTLGKIISLVEAAENSKTESTRMVDQYAKWFTPVILSLAVMTFFVTKDLNRAITVLIVGCPCSFLLAGPVPTIAAIGRAAQSGIMIKGGSFLEGISKSVAVYFDKTGTITNGEPQVTKIETGPSFSQGQLLFLAASVEYTSRHPLAKAIVARAQELGLNLQAADNVKVIAGSGIEGRVDGQKVFIGSASVEGEEGETVVEVKVDGQLAGFITLLDKIRENAQQTIEHIRDLGIKDISIISGDYHSAVEKVAKEIGVNHYYARLKPDEKYEKIESYDNGPLVYVGDGMNDAPALKKADVGIAMGVKGADITLETADIVFINDRIDLLPFLITLSRRMTRTINANIILSFTINFLSLAAGFVGLLTPILGAFSHNFGSILVVLLSASLTLQKEKIRI
ncbi:MAG: cadmium-translocating P-type ATPase [Spirochaetes bacterium]|nr:cadmium-translocating P-type ATPase [Spirochaetota bacterium]